MLTVMPGSKIQVRDFGGRRLIRRAVTGVIAGQRFPVVWACSEQEWHRAQEESREPDGMPWPADVVSSVDGADG
jgi:hypothetical protein